MRLLVLSNLYPPDFTGGYELGCSQVVDGLRQRGHEVAVLTSAARQPADNAEYVWRWLRLVDLSNAYSVSRFRAAALAHREAEARLISAFNVQRVVDALEQFRPEVCYVWNLIGLGGLGILASLQYLGYPWVWHLMDAVPVVLCTIGGRVIQPLARHVGRTLQGGYLSCSRRVLDEIRGGGITLQGPSAVVPNWVAGPEPAPRRGYRRGGLLRIVSAGQIGRHKGTDIVIEAAARLRKRGHDAFRVDIYGQVTDALFPHWIEKLQLGQHVFLHGLRTPADLATRYRDDPPDVFVLPTWAREPFAFAPLEAAAHGCLPVISQRCGNADWFIHGLDCLKVERSAEGLAAALAGILSNQLDLPALGRRAQRTVWRYFSLDRLLPQIETTLARAAGEKPHLRGSTRDLCRIAGAAEKLAHVLVQQAA